MSKESEKPVVEVKHHTYQPSRNELRQDVSIATSPDRLAAALGRQVDVKETKPR